MHGPSYGLVLMLVGWLATWLGLDSGIRFLFF